MYIRYQAEINGGTHVVSAESVADAALRLARATGLEPGRVFTVRATTPDNVRAGREFITTIAGNVREVYGKESGT